jgi:outer membrane immunogenic protein
MRRDVLFGIGLLASVGAGAGSAVAADLPVRPAAAPAMVAPAFVPDWVGFYVGIHGGGGWARESFDSSVSQCDVKIEGCTFDSFQLPSNVNPKGGVFGFQFGHNWQWGPVVGGLEIDFSGADIKGSSTFSVFPCTCTTDTFTTDKKIDELASARGRLGYLIFPNWLLYGTAGIGWGHERITTTALRVRDGILTEEDNANSNINMFGWVAGVGLEWKFWPGSNSWLLRGEWLHYDFGKVTNATNNPELFRFFGFDNGNVRTTVDVARAALSYKF